MFNPRVLILAALLLVCGVFNAKAQYILQVDISDPSAVKFIATGSFAAFNDIDGTTLQEGFTLYTFFTDSVNDSNIHYFDVSSLASPGGAFNYMEMVSIDYLGGTLYYDLNVFGSGFSTQDFSTSAAAFTGSATADLSDWASFFPNVGSTGTIYSGDAGSNPSAINIGQWVVIPEPSTYALLALGAGVLLLARRKAVLA